MTTTPTFWRSLGQVNKNDTGPTGVDQDDPVVIGLANGNLLVAYTDDTNSDDSANGSDIIGKIYSPLGAQIGNPIQLNTFRSVDDEGNPDIAALSDGGFVVVYEDVDASGTSLIWEVFDASGSLERRGLLEDDPAGADVVTDPRVAVFDDDSFVVTYTRSVGANSELRARVVSDTGVVGSEFNIRSGGNEPRDASVAVLSNGNFVSVYVEDDGGDAKLEYGIFTAAGANVTTNNIVSVGGSNEAPEVAALAGGGFAMVWADTATPADEDIYVRVFGNGGTAVSGLIAIQDKTNVAVDPTITALQDGGFAVVYDDDTQDELVLQRFDSLGNTVGSATAIESAPPSAGSPSIGLLSDGRIAAAWEAFDTLSSGFDVSAAIWDPREPQIFGTSADDVLTARKSGTSTLHGLAGDDTLFGNSFFQRLYGDTGADSVFGGSGPDVIRDSDGLSGDLLNGGQGHDSLDMRSNSAFDSLVVVDLEAGFATVFGGSGDQILNFEDALVGGEASILGTSGDNRLSGGLFSDGNYIAGRSGDDTLVGYGGTDKLYGGSGDDSLIDTGNANGAAGTDRHYGGDGNDDIEASAGDDRVFGGSGDDTVQGETGDDSLYGEDGQDSLIGQSGKDRLFGGSGIDFLSGGSGNDSLEGGSSDDLIYGYRGNDEIEGGQGDDFVRVGDGNDYAYGGGGNDTLFARSGNDVLFGGNDDDILTFYQFGSDQGFGGNGNDTIFGGTGDGLFRGDANDDIVYGGDGDDTIGFQTGQDKGYGGSGNDRLFGNTDVIDGSDVIDGGSGTDRLLITQASQAPSLPDLTGIEAISFIGTSGADSITGQTTSATEYFFGGAGNDDMRAFSGHDRMYGGTGNDSLRGFSGDDSLYDLSGGNDTLFGGDGADTLVSGSGKDRLVGGSGVDLVYGETGSDRLNGGSGNDTAFGGKNNDTFIIETLGDVVVEVDGGGGQDVIRLNGADYTLANDALVERINMTRTAGAARATGNGQDNTLLGNSFGNQLTGGSGDDVLNGFGGSDLMIGGTGQDTYVVDTATDVAFELAGEGRDLVRALVDYTISNDIEDLRMQGGAGNIDGVGNDLGNSLQGNSGDNALFGGAGNDTIWGRDGLDQLYGGRGSDTLDLENLDTAFGGSSKDSFFFDGDEVGNGAGSGGPVIGDFQGQRVNGSSGLDRLVFATGLETGSFAYIGGQAFHAAGNSEVRHDGGGSLLVDQDGDGSADLFFRVEGMSQAGQLTATDFVWLA